MSPSDTQRGVVKRIVAQYVVKLGSVRRAGTLVGGKGRWVVVKWCRVWQLFAVCWYWTRSLPAGLPWIPERRIAALPACRCREPQFYSCQLLSVTIAQQDSKTMQLQCVALKGYLVSGGCKGVSPSRNARYNFRTAMDFACTRETEFWCEFVTMSSH